ncbi:phosphoethanolamine transferase [Neisseria lisongii]|uniref:Phosphoethanolamine transferase n=1 Tax=Neisseria lisongii TaxID=2912188 RepID=A0AAW5AKN9_9NEIS|nr:phosphoethanolamine transferase [Neisseria lisongii]MCF7530111.1 phosphoethanolamine transferase [Neisseria lisongii]
MKKSILILLLYSFILLISEIAYRFIFNLPSLQVTKILETFAVLFVMSGIFYFAKYRTTRIVAFVFFSLSIIANNVHYAVYQSWITGINYWLMFKEITEVSSAGLSMIDKLWPHLLWGILECLFYLSLNKFRKNVSIAADLLFWIPMLLIPIRSFNTNQEMGVSPKPEYGRIKANYFSFGYFLGRTLPYQIFNLSSIPVYNQPAPEKISEGRVKNIILVMGESESAVHLKLFGYHRETSPFLTNFAQSPLQPIIKPTYSAGLMTAVSLPSFFNAIPHPNGYQQINLGYTNLFRLAKEQGYETHFYSTQATNEMAIMNLIGNRWIDKLIMPTDLGYSGNQNIADENLLPLLSSIDLTKGKHFIVLHQRGSHVPYGALLSDKDKIFGEKTIIDKYDNTIHKTDSLLETVYNRLQSHPDQDWIFAYTSDHGQFVTEKTFNQGTIQPNSYLVPMVIYSPKPSIQALAHSTFDTCQTAFHQQLSVLLVQILGYDMASPGCSEGTVTGNLITGDAGFLHVKQGRVQYIYPK